MKQFEDDWKLFFEAVLMFLRNGKLEQAENLVKDTLKVHFVTG